jgi:TnsA endonuclease N terminal
LAHPRKTLFTPKNPKKYIGPNINNIISRSSWETSFMLVMDESSSIIQWNSESIRIPYRHPFTGKYTIYVPDFFVLYNDRNGVEHRELIEIKPSDEVPGYAKKVSKLKEARQRVNNAKWHAAQHFCARRNWFFRIATEKDLFPNPKR